MISSISISLISLYYILILAILLYYTIFWTLCDLTTINLISIYLSIYLSLGINTGFRNTNLINLLGPHIPRGGGHSYPRLQHWLPQPYSLISCARSLRGPTRPRLAWFVAGCAALRRGSLPRKRITGSSLKLLRWCWMQARHSCFARSCCRCMADLLSFSRSSASLFRRYTSSAICCSYFSRR